MEKEQGMKVVGIYRLGSGYTGCVNVVEVFTLAAELANWSSVELKYQGLEDRFERESCSLPGSWAVDPGLEVNPRGVIINSCSMPDSFTALATNQRSRIYSPDGLPI